MVRGTTRKKWVMVALRSGMNVEGIVEAVASLPVAAKDEARKTALAKELKDLARKEGALYRRIRAAADKLDQLPVEDKLVR